MCKEKIVLEVSIKETSLVEVTPDEINWFKDNEVMMVNNLPGLVESKKEWLDSLSDYEIAEMIARDRVIQHCDIAILDISDWKFKRVDE